MLDYKSIFNKFIERLFELDTTETKLDISYYSHYPKPKQIQYEKAHSYLLNEFKRIETKELYDFEYSFNMIQDELSDFILLIHEYNMALEQGGAEFDFYIDFWNNDNIKILEESISLFKKKINSTEPMKKSIENDQINSNKDLSFYLILLKAYTANQKQKISFKSFFKREAQIENRNNYVEFQDFFDGCLYAIKSYKNEIIRQYNKRLTENDWVVTSIKSGFGLKIENEIITDQSDLRIKEHLKYIEDDKEFVQNRGYENNYDYTCFLNDTGEVTTDIWMQSNERKLHWQDIMKIEQGFNKAKEELVFDNSISTNPIPLQVNPRSVPSDNLSIDSQVMSKKNDYDIDMYAYNLGHCISTATRWDMKAIKKTTTDATPFSVFGTYFEKQREYFDNFKKALRLEFDNPQNSKGFEIDIKSKFNPMIKRYYDWYDKHKEETKIFEPYNFYEWIFEWAKDTENEIKKYFDNTQINAPNSSKGKSSSIKEVIKENKVISERIINVLEFEKYFNSSFRGYGENNINQFEKLIEDLKQNRSGKEFAQIALLIFNSKHMNNRKPIHFSEWYHSFCECVGCEEKTYKPKDLRSIREDIQKLFSYLLI